MPLIPYPDVPDSPGVPDVPRNPDIPPDIAAPITFSLGSSANALATSAQSPGQWGIYDSTGAPLWQSQDAGVVLSTYAFEFMRENRISDFQVEEGSFASYNKVNLPGNPVVTIALSGNETARAAFLTTMEAVSKSLDLYSVVTPDATYANYNVERYSYQRRAGKGCTLLVVEISLKEIRQVSAQYSTAINQPQDASATPQTNTGMVQAQGPPTSVLSSMMISFSGLGAN